MKRGDIVEKSDLLPAGKVVWRGLGSYEEAEASISKLSEHYNFEKSAEFIVSESDEFEESGLFCIRLLKDARVYKRAKVNWIVDNEAGITYIDSGGSNVVDVIADGWTVVQEAAPEYHSDVEHMTEEQLRDSIEQLRANRSVKSTRVKKETKEKEPALSTEDKDKLKVIQAMTPEQKEALMRKLGMIE